MIDINLTPPDERENKLWILPDLAVYLVVYLIGSYCADYYLKHIRDEIALVEVSQQEIKNQIRKIKPQLMRYDSLNAEVESLRGKILAVQQITSSKTDRYRSVILIDILDNLRPKGIWFANLSDDTGSQTIYLSGGGFDPLLIAKFMTNLIALKRQKVSIKTPKVTIHFVVTMFMFI